MVILKSLIKDNQSMGMMHFYCDMFSIVLGESGSILGSI